MQEVFDRYISYLRAEKNASEYTVRNYTSDLLGGKTPGAEKGFFQFLVQRGVQSLTEVDRQTVREYIVWLMDRHVVKNSIARKLSAIRSFFRYLLRENILETSPLEQGASPKRDQRLPSFLSIDEAERLLESPNPSTAVGLRDRALLELLYASGLRVSEVVSLDLGQANLDTNEIRVRGKGSRERVVLMGEPAARALAAYSAHGRPELLEGKTTSALFVTRNGERLTPRRVQKIVDRHAHTAGIGRRVHPHMLRHSFATHMLDGGADLRVVQELLGHAHLSSTQVYTHVSKSQARKVYLSAHPLAGRPEEGVRTR